MLALCRVLSLREIVKHPGRSAILSASVALGVVAWTMTWALDGALDASLREASAPAAHADFFVSNGDSGLALELVSRVAVVEGVASARPVVIERIRILGQRTASAILLGVDLASYGEGAAADIAVMPSTSIAFLRGKILGQNPVLLGAALRQQIAPEGDLVTAVIGGKKRKLKCVGTLDPAGPLSTLGGSIVLTGDREAADLAGHPGRINRIDVGIRPGFDRNAVRDRIAHAIGMAAEVITPEAQDGRIRESLGALRKGFALCGVGALVLALFLVANVMGVSVAERGKTIGLLRSIGSTSGQVRGEILGESLILGAIGTAIGVPTGFVLARLSLGLLLHAVGDVFLPLQSEGIAIDPSVAVGGVLVGLATSLIAAWMPASRASAMSPIRAMKSGGGEPSTSPNRRAISASLLIVLSAAAFLGVGCISRTAGIYLSLGMALTSVVVSIPLLTGGMARALRPIFERLAGVPGRLAIDSLIRSPSRTGSTIASLAGGVALMIQTGGVIQGNESAVRSWVDGVITGDLFVTSGGPMSASGRTAPMDESIASQIADTLRGAIIVPMRFRQLDWLCRGEKTRVLLLALNADDYAKMSANRIPPLRDRHLYHLLASPGTALVSENFAALNGVKIGSMISLPGGDGPVSLRVVGTVVDFSNSRGTILVDRQGVGRAFTTSAVDLFVVGLRRGSDPEAARVTLGRSGWAAENGIEAMTRSAMRSHILGMIRRLYSVAYVQEIAAAIVAALGVSASMLICVVQRRRELGLLRALGATSGQIFLTVIAEAAAMAVIGVVLGVALGLALEWYVLRVILLLETGFNFPVLLPWVDGLMVAAVVGIASIISGLLPALSASRMGIGAGLTHAD